MTDMKMGAATTLKIMTMMVCSSCALETNGRYEQDAPDDLSPDGTPETADLEIDAVPDPVEDPVDPFVERDEGEETVTDPPDETDADVPLETDGPGCDDGEAVCAGDVLTRCIGGRWVDEETCALGCDPGLGRCLHPLPSNVPPDLWGRSDVDVVVGSRVQLDTTDCDPAVFGDAVPFAQVVDVGSGIDLCVMAMGSLTVEAGGILEVSGVNGLVLLVSRDVLVDGTIDAGAEGGRTGPGGGPGGAADENAAGICGGGRGELVITSYYENSGGGGGGHGARGGQGGGTVGGADGGTGGSTDGTRELVPLTGGCGGGGGSRDTLSGGGPAGPGGAGGGALQITSGTLISVGPSGRILAGGGGGTGGETWSGGGGGGAGGGILLEAPSVDIEGIVAANGGGGGACDDGENGADGGAGDTRAEGGDVFGSYGAAGGDGGAGAMPEGLPAPTSDVNGGGGGGAAGRIRINVRAGDMSVTGTVSPSATATFSLGELAAG